MLLIAVLVFLLDLGSNLVFALLVGHSAETWLWVLLLSTHLRRTVRLHRPRRVVDG